jgi:hypothetical protein
MKESSDVICCVVDHGLFLPWADMLSRGFKKVYYHTPWEKGFPKLADMIIGDGYERIERCDDIFDIIDDVDLFCFPDIGFNGLQVHLEKYGKKVWGSKKADDMEVYREYFMNVVENVGLSVPKYEKIKGLGNLKLLLKDKTDKYIKVSKFRGDFETHHYRSWREDEGFFDKWAVQFGPLKEEIRFLVIDPIKTEIEDGYDGYTVDGKFPKQAIHGIECKDKGYLCAVQDYNSLPEQIIKVNEAMVEKLSEYRYRNNFSTEVRITDDDFYFIDPTCRCGSPPSQIMAELLDNWCDIVWHGAHGELVEMSPIYKYGVQTVMNLKWDAGNWGIADFPKEIRQWVKCGNSCEVDGRICYPPQEDHDTMIGWVCGAGNTLEEAIEHLKENSEMLPDGVHTDTQSLVSLINEMEEAEKLDIFYGNDPIPDPAMVLE